MYKGTEIGIHIVGPQPPDSSLPVRLYAVVDTGEKLPNGDGTPAPLDYSMSHPLITFDMGGSPEPDLGTDPIIHSDLLVIQLAPNLLWCQYKLYIKAFNALKGGGEGYRVWLPENLNAFLPVPGEAEPCANAALFINQGSSPHLFDGSVMWTTRKWPEQGEQGKFIFYFDHDEWGAEKGNHPKPWAVGDHTARGGFTLRCAPLTWYKELP